MKCHDCDTQTRDGAVLWTAPGGYIVCGDCYETRTGARPLGLVELNAKRKALAERQQ